LPGSHLDRPAVLAGLIALLCLIWGSTWFAIKVGLEAMPPLFAAGLRFLAASAILFGLGSVQRVRASWSPRLHLGLVALGMCVHSVSYGVVYWGEQYLPAGLTAVLFAIYPLLVALLAAWVMPDEPLSVVKVAGILLGFAGVAVIFLDDVSLSHPRATLAAAVVLLSPLAAAFSSVGIKKFGAAIHPYTLTTLPMLYGGAMLLGVSASTEDWGGVRWSGSAVAALLYLTVFGSVIAFVTYYTLLKRVAVSRLALISYMFPVVAVLIDVLVLGVRLGARAWIGSALVVLGVAMAGVRRRAALAPVGGSRA
jgi:drug/metabolite transporter (DMT)-like permease